MISKHLCSIRIISFGQTFLTESQYLSSKEIKLSGENGFKIIDKIHNRYLFLYLLKKLTGIL